MEAQARSEPTSAACAAGGWRCRPGPTTTRRPARWPTSWRAFASRPHATLPITLPATSCLPLVTIGPTCADSMSARTITSPLQMPDIRLHALPKSQTYRSVLVTSGRVHIRRVRPHCSTPLSFAYLDRPSSRRLVLAARLLSGEALHKQRTALCGPSYPTDLGLEEVAV